MKWSILVTMMLDTCSNLVTDIAIGYQPWIDVLPNNIEPCVVYKGNSVKCPNMPVDTLILNKRERATAIYVNNYIHACKHTRQPHSPIAINTHEGKHKICQK